MFSVGYKSAVHKAIEVCNAVANGDLEARVINITESGPAGELLHSINRIIDVFPAGQQNQVRLQLAFELIGVISQQLVPNKSGNGRILASEILVTNHAIRALIREQRLHQVYSALQTSRQEGMYTMNHSLSQLVKLRKISSDVAFACSADQDELAKLLPEMKLGERKGNRNG